MKPEQNELLRASRREVLKAGAAAAGWGAVGLALPKLFFSNQAFGATPDAALKKYDAVIQVFMTGGPSQTDTWDPKPETPDYNVFPWFQLGVDDIYGKPIYLSNYARPDLSPGLTSFVGRRLERAARKNAGI